jgi:GT2 family glycosyltransferase
MSDLTPMSDLAIRQVVGCQVVGRQVVGRHVAGARRPPATPYDADVVILALDRAEDTEAAIFSALSQTGVSRHVVVVDQGSRPEALARLARAVNGRADATLVALDHNHGVPGGRNIGTNFGHGRVIAGLDNDAVFDSPTTLARMVEAIDADADLGAIGCRIVVDSTGTVDLSSWGYPGPLLRRSRETFETATFVGAGHAIRREAWDDAGGYDARLFFCWEEYDFCLRAIARFWRIRYRGDIVIRHKINPERRVAWSGDRWFHYVRNRVYIGRKIGQSWPELLPRMAAYCVKAARNGCLRDTPRAFWAAFKMAHGVTHARLPPVARDYLYRTDTVWRGGPLTRLRREILAALPGVQFNPAHATEASIRAITSGGGGPASDAATHSASS